MKTMNQFYRKTLNPWSHGHLFCKALQFGLRYPVQVRRFEVLQWSEESESGSGGTWYTGRIGVI